MKFKPYPKYKPSGVDIPTEIPFDWEIKRGRFLMEVNPSTPHPLDKMPVDCVFVPMESIGVAGKLDISQTRASEDIGNGYTPFKNQDVIVAKITPCFENGKTALVQGLTSNIAFGTTELHVLRAFKTVYPKFLFYVAISHDFRKLGEAEMYGAGGQKRVPPDFCKNVRIAFPSLKEQIAIAQFLDRETERVDQLIEKKSKLIERLKEKRTALISRTVTKGLPPQAARAAGLPVNTKMKDSGIEWLGAVPEHWDVKRLKYVASINDEVLPETTPPDFEFKYLDIGGVSPDVGKTWEETLAFEKSPSRARRKVRPGDVIISTVRTYLRAILAITEKGTNLIVSTGFAVVRPKQINAKFMGFALKEKGFVEQIVRRSDGVSYPAINASEIGALEIPLPPPEDQELIARFLGSECAKITELLDKVSCAVEHLEEMRSTLITNAVTGKINVTEMTHAQ